MKRLRSKLTYANVVATLALFLVVAGGSAFAATHLAKNSVGARQIKKNAVTAAKIRSGAVTTAKIRNGAVTGAKIAAGSIGGPSIDISSLGTVPNAASAGRATDAGHAVSADHATVADSAGDAGTVGGKSAAQLTAAAKLTCPAGTTMVAQLCFEQTTRAPATWLAAIRTCGQAGRQLPSVGQLTAYDVAKTDATFEMTDDIYFYKPYEAYVAQIINVTNNGYTVSVNKALGGETAPYRCVVPPGN